jgi:uncharacterized protein (TIGR03067 family)
LWTANPKQIEYIVAEGDHKGYHFRSIYTLEENDHWICSDGSDNNRPKEFSGQAGFLRVLKRVKK